MLFATLFFSHLHNINLISVYIYEFIQKKKCVYIYIYEFMYSLSICFSGIYFYMRYVYAPGRASLWQPLRSIAKRLWVLKLWHFFFFYFADSSCWYFSAVQNYWLWFCPCKFDFVCINQFASPFQSLTFDLMF